ncbi:mycofactocin system transcriptional regulator [Aeromicrobium sp. A1-2]|uniref:mycofactocin system transcriptional regulator n=1 Tax=Aeromicrobium sp. A1-2 TaxID=2107713 RepID=UPI000E4C1FA0|nr:mycofactocin system transcriptional regulator [Aeromicrobium sp. A1-2]AXT84268.1 mycofactocin system transcriptional regulator [Aeromicrobium sp. A1-2]
MTAAASPRTMPGRPVATTHAEIEQAAFRLFDERGFEKTTLDALAAEVGVGRRTLFRYYNSKNDIPWGEFGASLDAFRGILASMPLDIPLWEAIHRGVLAFNDFDADTTRLHRQRMALILTTPALQAHSVHQYAEWRRVISDYVAARLDLAPDDMLPRVVGHVSLALAISAYEQWLADETAPLLGLVDRAMGGLRQYLNEN